MKKVVLNYDEVTGNLTDRNGTIISCWVGLQYEELPQTVEPDGLRKLKEVRAMGFGVDELERLKSLGLLGE